MSMILSTLRLRALRYVAYSRLLSRKPYALALLLAVFALLNLPAAHAQAISGSVALTQQISAVAGTGSGSVTTRPTGATTVNVIPQAVAVDSAGNQYIADSNTNAVEMITPAGNISVIAGGSSTQPSSAAIAATTAALNLPANKTSLALYKGNLYVADYISATSTTVIDEITGPASGSAQITALFGNGSYYPSPTPEPLSKAELYSITGMAFDSAGNLYLADFGKRRVYLVTGLGGSNAQISVIAGWYCNQGPFASPSTESANQACVKPYGVAVDSAGNLYVSDQYGNNNGYNTVDLITGVTGTNPQISVIAGYNCYGGPYSYPDQANQACITPTGIAADAKGNVYIDDQNNEYVDVITGASGGNAQITAVAGYSSTGTAPTTTPESAESAYFFGPVGIAVDSVGNTYIADDRTDLVDLLTPSLTNILPSTSVGAASATQNVMVELTAASAISSITVPKAQNGAQEFTVGTVTGCDTGGVNSNPANTICTVPVTFNPQYPGARTGALTVNNGTTVVGTLGLNGIGNGPFATLQPGTQSTVATAGLSAPNGVAVDEAGDLFVADFNNKRVVEIAAGGTQTVVPVTGLGGPASVAVDAAGNLYVSDIKNNNLVELTTGGSQSTLSLPPFSGMTVDAAGNLYGLLQFMGNWAVLQVSNGNVNGVLPVSGLSNPQGIAVDAAGNFYITDCGNDDVVELTPNGNQTIVPTTGLNCPEGIALDAAGDLYIADSGNKRVVEVSPAGVQSTLSVTGLAMPSGVAIDGAGNLFVADNTNNNVVELNPSATAPLSFTADGTGDPSAQQTVTLANIGNQPLNITALTATTTGQTSSSFTLNGAATTCATGTPLAAGTTCGLGVELDPLAAGSLAGTVNITDNSLNIAANLQQISLSGTGTGFAATMMLTPSATTVAYGTAATITATLTGTNGTPGGSISYTLDGTQQPSIALSASGTAVITVPSELAAGTHSVTVSYGGDSNYVDATPTQSVNLIVTPTPPAATTTTLASSANSITAGSSVTLTATVLAGGSPVASGLVTFSSNGASIGVATTSASGVATLTTTLLPAGTDNVTATFVATSSDAASTSSSVTVTVTAATIPPSASYTITASPSSLTIVSGQIAETTLTFTPLNGYTGSVTLSCGTLPAQVSCVFAQGGVPNSNTVTMTGNNQPVNVALYIQTGGAQLGVNVSALVQGHGGQPMNPILPALAFWGPGGLAGLAAFGKRKKLSKKQFGFLQLGLLVLLTGALAAGISGCGGSAVGAAATSSPSKPLTPAGTSTVVITAAPASGSSQTLNLSVTITG